MNNDIHEEVNSAQKHEEYTNNTVEDQSVSVPSTALKKRYIQAHKNEKHQCDVCTRTFTSAGYLSRHKLIHASVKKYDCDGCTKSFTHANSLRRHKLIHAGVKNYQCNICSKSFTQSGNLSQHKLIHAGVKMYQCDACTKKFTLTVFVTT